MICQCPACGRTTRVAPDLLGFLTRCERCRSMLLTRVIEPADGESGGGPDAQSMTVHVVATGRVSAAPAVAGWLADLLSRPKPVKREPAASEEQVWQALETLASEDAEVSLETLALRCREQEQRLAAARPNGPRRRKSLRAIVVLTLATAAALLLYALAIGLERTLLRPDTVHGASVQPVLPTPDEPASTKADASSAPSEISPPRAAVSLGHASERAASAAPEGSSGELFPHVRAQR